MNKHESADRATLECALEEVVGTAKAPDLSAAIMAAAEGTPASAPHRPWLPAALALIAAGLVITVFVFRPSDESGNEPSVKRGDTPLKNSNQDPQPPANTYRPKTLAEADQWLAQTESLTVRIDSVWAPLSKRYISTTPAWTLFFRPDLKEITHEDDVYRHVKIVREALSDSQRRPKTDPDRMGDRFQYRFEILATKDGKSMRIQVEFNPTETQGTLRLPDLTDPTAQPKARITGPSTLTKILVRLTRKSAIRRIVTSDTGLDRLPDDQEKIQAHDLTFRGLRKLTRFAKLRHLDLSDSPTAISEVAFADGNSLRLPSVTGLSLNYQNCRSAHIEFCLRLTPNLKDFMLLPRDWAPSPASFLQLATPLPSSKLSFDDQATRALAGFTQLESIFLFACSASDLGIASLATLPHLKELRVHSAQIDGTGFREFATDSKLRRLYLSEVNLSRAGADAIASLPITWLHLTLATGDVSALAPLAKSTTITKLTLFAPKFRGDSAAWRGALRNLAAIKSLQKLNIDSHGVDLRDLEAFQPTSATFEQLTIFRPKPADETLIDSLRGKVSFKIHVDR